MSRKNRKSRYQRHIETIDKMIQAIKDGTAPRSMLSGKTIMELNESKAFCLMQQQRSLERKFGTLFTDIEPPHGL